MLLPTTKVLDLRYFPLVTLALPATLDMSYADLLEHDTRALFALRRRYVSISDSSGVVGMPEAKTRKRMAEWAKSHEDAFRHWQVANVLIVNSTIVRAGISAIHWLAPPPVPTRVETDWGVGLAFLRQHAQEEGLDTTGLSAFAQRQREQHAAS
jgi:hypothetical protein